MILIANNSSNPEVKSKLINLLDYIKDIINISEVTKTLDNVQYFNYNYYIGIKSIKKLVIVR